MIKDMHIHSNFSDGQYSPKELLEKIEKAGITEFALTDHDNIDGLKIMQNLVKDKKIKFHPGVEISSRINELNINVHLLCYDFDLNNEKVLDLMEELKQKRIHKLDLMIDYVKEHFGYKISDEQKEKLLKENNVVGKPHIWALISKDLDIETESFYRVLDGLKSENLKADSKEVINVFHSAGGVVVLAHPIEIEDEYKIDSLKAIEFLKQFGLDGLETKHSKHTQKDYLRFKSIAKNLGLFQSFGSDFHGEKIKPNVKLGDCEKNEKELIK